MGHADERSETKPDQSKSSGFIGTVGSWGLTSARASPSGTTLRLRRSSHSARAQRPKRSNTSVNGADGPLWPKRWQPDFGPSCAGTAIRSSRLIRI